MIIFFSVAIGITDRREFPKTVNRQSNGKKYNYDPSISVGIEFGFAEVFYFRNGLQLLLDDPDFEITFGLLNYFFSGLK